VEKIIFIPVRSTAGAPETGLMEKVIASIPAAGLDANP
jgi:hypothetical protein